MAPSNGDEQPLPLRELARRVGISEGTLRSWEKAQDRPLRTRRGPARSVTSTVADLRAFCAAHPELRAAGRAAEHLDNPVATMDVESLRTILQAVLVAVRATTAAHIALADATTTQCRAHSTALSSALRGLDQALTQLTPTPPEQC